MAREIIDIAPIARVWATRRPIATDMEAAKAQGDLIAEVLCEELGRGYDYEISYETDARCSHCRCVWTEEGAEYNGGCCGRDEANSPDRLNCIRVLANEVDGADLYSVYEGRRSPVPIHWPATLATATLAWLDAGRPADQAPGLIPLIRRCMSSEWCTVWSDPGVYPSGAGGSALPDEVTIDARPEELGDDLLRLIDDMGLNLSVAA